MTKTVNISLSLPNFDVSPWHDEVNDNFRVLDAVIQSNIDGRSIQGVWANATAYTVGQVLVDSAGGSLWACLIAHTTHSTDTFEEDRTTNPTYWQIATIWERAAGTWATTTAYSVGDFVVSGQQYAVCIKAHTSTTAFATDIANWEVLLDATTLWADMQTSESASSDSAAAALISEQSATASALLLSDFEHVGNWSAIAYTKHQMVDVTSGTFQGWSFICMTDHTGTVFDTNYLTDGYWNVIAQRGATGAGVGDLLAVNNLNDVSNATTSRNNLGAAAAGANSDITSIAGLTTALTIAQGGTGATTAAAVRTALALVYGTDIAGLSTANAYSKQQYTPTQTLTVASDAVAWDLDSNQVATVTFATSSIAAKTLSNPTNMQDGATYILRMVQPASGTLKQITFESAYVWEGGTAPELTQTFDAIDIFSFVAIGGVMFGTIMRNMG